MGGKDVETISESLRAAILGSGMTVLDFANACGVPQPMLSRFMAGKDLRLATADRIAGYCGLVLGKPPAEVKGAAKRGKPAGAVTAKRKAKRPRKPAAE